MLWAFQLWDCAAVGQLGSSDILLDWHFGAQSLKVYPGAQLEWVRVLQVPLWSSLSNRAPGQESSR